LGKNADEGQTRNETYEPNRRGGAKLGRRRRTIAGEKSYFLAGRVKGPLSWSDKGGRD